jgi:predicted dehydrogenase
VKKVAILGAGGMGSVHARHYANLPVEVGVFDLDAERASKLSSTVFNNAEEAIAWADIVDICLPSDLHEEFALKAIEAGKATFVEKPIAPTWESAQRIVNAANETGVSLMVGQVVRYFPAYASAHKAVKEGKFGRVAAVRMRRGGGLPRSPWFLEHEKSGGVLVDLAVHEFDWLNWTFGPVDHLYAKSVGSQNNDKGPDYGLCTLTFKSGMVAHVEATWMDPAGFRMQFEICGSDGMMQFDSQNSNSLTLRNASGIRGESPVASTDDPFFLQLQAFVGSVIEGKEAPVTGSQGLEALRIALAALESARTNQVIQL